MKNLLKLEELAQFALSIYIFTLLDYSWWVFPACLLLPDLSMVGYLVNTRFGAWIYNFFHHKMLAIAVLIIGAYLEQPWIVLSGVILFGHSAMDRLFGYGFKYPDSFKHTHLE